MRKVIGLTGGIASGKSTVANMFIAAEVPVIDTDVIAHAVGNVATVQQEIQAVFGDESVKDGALNRLYLAQVIFKDEGKRAALNQIMHPVIKARVIQDLTGITEGLVVVDVPLLYEAGFDDLMDVIVLVYAPQDVQIARLMQRDHLNEAEALARVHSQMPIEEKVKRADYVLDNTGTEAALYLEFQKLYEKLNASIAERSR